MKRYPIVSLAIILLLMVSACSSAAPTQFSPTEPLAEDTEDTMLTEGEETESEPQPTATDIPPTETLEPTMTSTPRTILWEDDFSDINSGWERYRHGDGVLDYLEAEGVYQMQMTQEGNFYWVSMEGPFTDLVMEIDVSQVDGPEGSLFGVMCRFDSTQLNGVVFAITSLGQAGIGTIENFSFTPLAGGELTAFDSINTGLEAINTMEVVCVGDSVRLAVNGDVLIELNAPDVQGDQFGLVVDSSFGSGVDVYFDNLFIYQP